MHVIIIILIPEPCYGSIIFLSKTMNQLTKSEVKLSLLVDFLYMNFVCSYIKDITFSYTDNEIVQCQY